MEDEVAPNQMPHEVRSAVDEVLLFVRQRTEHLPQEQALDALDLMSEEVKSLMEVRRRQ